MMRLPARLFQSLIMVQLHCIILLKTNTTYQILSVFNPQILIETVRDYSSLKQALNTGHLIRVMRYVRRYVTSVYFILCLLCLSCSLLSTNQSVRCEEKGINDFKFITNTRGELRSCTQEGINTMIPDLSWYIYDNLATLTLTYN